MPTNNLRGAVLMVIAIALLATMDATVKWLVTHQVEVMQILAVRSVIIVFFMVGLYQIRGRGQEIIPTRPIAQLLRGLFGFIAPFTFFLGLKYVPLTDGVVVFFSSIFVISFLSMVFLGERVGPHRWASIVIGYIGVLIVVQPQGGGQWIGYALVLLSSSSYAVLFVSGRYLSSTESTPSLVISYNLGVGILALIFLPWFWVPLDTAQITILLLATVLAGCGHFAMTSAFAHGEASFIAPFEYTALLWAIMFDLIVWHHMPGTTTLLGATFVIGSGLYVAYREQLANRVNKDVAPKSNIL